VEGLTSIIPWVGQGPHAEIGCKSSAENCSAPIWNAAVCQFDCQCVVAAFDVGASTIHVNEHRHRVALGGGAVGVGVVRLAARTHAGRAGRQPLDARASSPLLHCVHSARRTHLAARDPQPAGQRQIRRATPVAVSFARSCCRTTSAGRLTRTLGVARPFGLRRSGLCPHQSPSLGRLKSVGAFLTGGSPEALGSTGLGRCGRGCGVLNGLASCPMRYARSAGTTTLRWAAGSSCA
jgi:hypothetical protein